MAKIGRKGALDEWTTEENLLRLEGWAKDGLSDKQICHNMGIGQTAFYDYKKRSTKFANALKRGKEVVDREVENALYKRAMGYSYYEVTEEPVVDETTNTLEMRVAKRVKKQIAPDVTAQIFWLKNRKPQDWRDKRDVELSGNVDVSSAIAKARERVKAHESKPTE